MTAMILSALALLALLVLAGRLSRLAARLAHAQARVERSRTVLDAALTRRAQQAVEACWRPGTDPVTTLLVGGAAAAALQPGQSRASREEAESRLSDVLAMTQVRGLGAAQQRVALARRLHNDAVTVVTSLRARWSVRMLGLAGRTTPDRAFEMLDGQELVWSGGPQG